MNRFSGEKILSMCVQETLVEIQDSSGEQRGAKPVELRYTEDENEIHYPGAWILYNEDGNNPVGLFNAEDALKWLMNGNAEELTAIDHTIPGLSCPLNLQVYGIFSWGPLTEDRKNVDLIKLVQNMQERADDYVGISN